MLFSSSKYAVFSASLATLSNFNDGDIDMLGGLICLSRSRVLPGKFPILEKIRSAAEITLAQPPFVYSINRVIISYDSEVSFGSSESDRIEEYPARLFISLSSNSTLIFD